MGKRQLEMFPPPPPTADELLNAAQAEMRLARMQRDRAATAAERERDRERSRRKRPVRARSVSMKRLSRRELAIGRALFPPEEHADVERPRTRAECKGGARPCPFVSCVHHLYLDVSARTGAIKYNFPDLEPDELAESCALDIADRHGVTLEEIGRVMNLTRERVRQVVIRALAKCHAASETHALRDFAPAGVAPKRRLPVLEDYAPSDFEGEAPAFDVDAFASDELAE